MSRHQKYKKWDKEKLISEICRLEDCKKYGLVWEDKPEDVAEQCREQLPVLEEVPERAHLKDGLLGTNILIEGDNYHALSVLNYTHKGAIDVVYIDPPYNTGARDWKYNNDYVDINDVFRHSKWLSMMQRRLLLSKDLLKDDGVLIVTIDKHEQPRIVILLEELFPDKEIVTVVIEHNPKGSPTRHFTYTNEFAIFVVPKATNVIGKDPTEKVDTRNLRRAGRASTRKERPTMFYPIYVRSGKVIRVGDTPDASFHPKKRNVVQKNGEIAIWPIDDDGRERRWHFGLDSINDYLDRIEVRQSKGEIQLFVTASPGRYKTVWRGGEFDAGKYGTSLVRDLIGVEFPYPKSVFATAKCLETVVHGRPDALILDYFAGSGTTGHATLYLNKKFGGNRRFILCTNNENDIAEDITFPRLIKVIDGHKDHKDTTGIPVNLRYFKTTFVKKSDVSDDTRRELVKRSMEMICVKEGTFQKIADNKQFKIYRDVNHVTGILYNLDAISEFKKKISDLGLSASIYVFSLTTDTYDADFVDLEVKYTLCPIPESILEVYRKLFA
ncbi:site-specific DNA-methyltransferase [Patescibacteria group bacterium]|nr:MAG: site-specific DNA-methyltransferase [Patescibacteria group bacterium]